jgi:hypothetical protein
MVFRVVDDNIRETHPKTLYTYTSFTVLYNVTDLCLYDTMRRHTPPASPGTNSSDHRKSSNLRTPLNTPRSEFIGRISSMGIDARMPDVPGVHVRDGIPFFERAVSPTKPQATDAPTTDAPTTDAPTTDAPTTEMQTTTLSDRVQLQTTVSHTESQNTASRAKVTYATITELKEAHLEPITITKNSGSKSVLSDKIEEELSGDELKETIERKSGYTLGALTGSGTFGVVYDCHAACHPREDDSWDEPNNGANHEVLCDGDPDEQDLVIKIMAFYPLTGRSGSSRKDKLNNHKKHQWDQLQRDIRTAISDEVDLAVLMGAKLVGPEVKHAGVFTYSMGRSPAWHVYYIVMVKYELTLRAFIDNVSKQANHRGMQHMGRVKRVRDVLIAKIQLLAGQLYVHTDLKASNIVVRLKPTVDVVLIDFGPNGMQRIVNNPHTAFIKLEVLFMLMEVILQSHGMLFDLHLLLRDQIAHVYTMLHDTTTNLRGFIHQFSEYCITAKGSRAHFGFYLRKGIESSDSNENGTRQQQRDMIKWVEKYLREILGK